MASGGQVHRTNVPLVSNPTSNNWHIKCVDMTANIQDYTNPQLRKIYKAGGGGRGNAISHKPATNSSADHIVKYHSGACVMGNR